MEDNRPTTYQASQNIYDRLSSEGSEPEIRLATIEPSDDASTPIHCTLRKERLTKECHYSALSYVWNAAPGNEKIYLNGYEFEVSKNLELALRQVRDGRTERILWVDALCINQGDLGER